MVNLLPTQPLAAKFGVQVDTDFSRSFDEAEIAELRQLFYTHGLIVACNQNLSVEDQIRIVEYIGTVPRSGQDGIGVLSNAADPNHNAFLKEFVRSSLAFHSDDAFSPDPTRAISLYGIDVVDAGSTTQFVSAAEACRNLPPALRAALEDKDALHVFGRYVETRNRLRTAESNDPFCFHPVLWKHPVTGEPILYVNYLMTDSIYGLAVDDSDRLIGELFGHLYAPDKIYEHSWHKGDFLLWDNFALQHARGRVDPDKVGPRKLRRVISADKGFMEMHPQFAH